MNFLTIDLLKPKKVSPFKKVLDKMHLSDAFKDSRVVISKSNKS
jgi:hypothetical protein